MKLKAQMIEVPAWPIEECKEKEKLFRFVIWISYAFKRQWMARIQFHGEQRNKPKTS